jgi:hypothetical protein
MNQWANYPNLRLRPAKPALGRGRLQRQVRRAFMVEDGPTISSSKIYEWAFARRHAWQAIDDAASVFGMARFESAGR